MKYLTKVGYNKPKLLTVQCTLVSKTLKYLTKISQYKTEVLELHGKEPAIGRVCRRNTTKLFNLYTRKNQTKLRIL